MNLKGITLMTCTVSRFITSGEDSGAWGGRSRRTGPIVGGEWGASTWTSLVGEVTSSLRAEGGSSVEGEMGENRISCKW